MSIFFAELRKLLGSARCVSMIAAAVIINVVFLIIPENSDYSPSAYTALWNRLDELPAEERAGFVEERIVDMFSPEYFSGTVTEFADNFYGEQRLLEDVLEEIRQADGYGEYLEGVDVAAENMKALSFFSDEESFNYRNIIKTQRGFSALNTENIVSGRSKGILLAVRFGASDILLLLLISMFTVKSVTSERERGYFPLIRTTVNGRARLGTAKLAAVVLASSAAALLLYGSGIAAGALVYGFGDIGRGIQSVNGFFACGEKISVGVFLIRFAAVKLLFCAAFSAAAFMFAALPMAFAAGCASIFAFAAVETLLYYAIPSTSVFAPLRQINLAAAADAAVLIGKYLNVNFFGYPVSSVTATLAASVLFAAVCGGAGVVLFSDKAFGRKCYGRKISGRKISGKTGARGANTNLAAHELYKCFVCGKGAAILFISAVAAIALRNPVKPYYNNVSDYIYYSYISEIKGEYTEDKADYIAAELEAASLDSTEYGAIKQEALFSLKNHAEYLSKNGGYFINDTGWKKLTGDKSVRVYDRLSSAVKTLVLIFITAYSYSAERRCGAVMLLRSSPNGRARTFLVKLSAAALCAFLILAIFDGVRICGVLSAWGGEFFAVPSCSMEHLAAVSMPIIAYIALTEALRFIGMTAVSAAVFFISERTGSYSAAVILSASVFAVPSVLSAMGLP